MVYRLIYDALEWQEPVLRWHWFLLATLAFVFFAVSVSLVVFRIARRFKWESPIPMLIPVWLFAVPLAFLSCLGGGSIYVRSKRMEQCRKFAERAVRQVAEGPIENFIGSKKFRIESFNVNGVKFVYRLGDICEFWRIAGPVRSIEEGRVVRIEYSGNQILRFEEQE